MEKRYQIFVSSTYVDLQEERQKIIHALLELDCIPAGMELFPAADDDQWTHIKKVIEDCDYYIVIVAGRYGSVWHDGISYTEKEYRYALEIGKPVLAFIHKSPESLPDPKKEHDDERNDKLDKFKELCKNKLCKYWDSPDNLCSVMKSSLIKEIKSHPAIGWIRGDIIYDIKEKYNPKEKINVNLTSPFVKLTIDAKKHCGRYYYNGRCLLLPKGEYRITPDESDPGGWSAWGNDEDTWIQVIPHWTWKVLISIPGVTDDFMDDFYFPNNSYEKAWTLGPKWDWWRFNSNEEVREAILSSNNEFEIEKSFKLEHVAPVWFWVWDQKPDDNRGYVKLNIYKIG
jgi:hypothetical protein